ncbi:replicative DNA helicase [uncultured Hyphomonas sp.]|uniref:replicative DNA helicase n=1 Tax=uncultured Hyphomonas sp. TaxID=225298 RepID=UPI000C695878|nr:replicative DNA helicase [Hyphomonadaceae bacterium]MBA30110.1 replicative DNA helicase [Hyphomonadaceae bacterium]QDP63704.1 MAG: putative ATP-dependent helicase [Prokaryotic dsDNA virus sp.]|tara:strand:- start:30169 stop:31695 length:1527 start_codon:yes stop_codon:yes gene_type:complete
MSDRKSMSEIHFPDRQPKAEPPHNLSAEAAVLGAILFDNNAFQRTQEILRHDDFYTEAHQELYHALEARIMAGGVADGVTMREHFETTGNLSQIGGADYLAQLLDSAAFGPEIDDYARMIRHSAARRAIMEAGDFLRACAESPEESGQITHLLETTREKLQSVEDMRLRGSRWESAQASTQRTFAQMEHMVRHGKPGEVQGLKTGIPDLDQKLQGLVHSRLIIMGGRPGMGKSGAAANFATHVAMTPHGEQHAPGPDTHVVGFFSLEMSKEDYDRRTASSLAHKRKYGRVEYQDIGQGKLGQTQLAVLGQGGRLVPDTLFIDDTPFLSASDIAVRSRALKRSAGRLDLIVIDYLQIMNFNIGRNENLSAAIGRTTSALKQMAKELRVPVMALSQLSRQVEQRENKRPMISDLRESGSVEQDADQIIFPFRPEYYLNKEEPPHGAKGSKEEQRWIEWWSAATAAKGVMEFNIAKNRHGAEGRVLAHYDAGTDALVPHKDDLEIKEGMFA